MPLISYARDRFAAEVIQEAVWLYFRFTLSHRDVEDLPTERGLEVSLRDGPALGADWPCGNAFTG